MANDVQIDTPAVTESALFDADLPDVAAAGAGHAPAPADTALNGDLVAGSVLLSNNGRFKAAFQADGNLVVYDTTRSGSDAVVWDSGTAGDAEGGRLTIEADGGLVIYGRDGDVAWDSGTRHLSDGLGPRDYTLMMQDDGHLVLRDALSGLPLWTNGTMIAPGDRLASGWDDTRALEYIASHPDLMNALGSSAEAGRAHFDGSGLLEDRRLTFSAADYLEANPDLAQAFGTDLRRAAEHWIDTGRYEGRPLAPGAVPEAPIPPFAFSDDDGDGRGIATIGAETHGDLQVEDPIGYSTTGRGTVVLDDGRRFVIHRPEGAPHAGLNRGSSITRDHLTANQFLMSPSGQFRAIFQPDGNFVVYDMLADGGPDAIWDSGTGGESALGRVVMQADGNLVIYRADGTTSDHAEWSSRTSNDDGEAHRNFVLRMNDDGSLTVTDSENADMLLWSSTEGKERDAAGIPDAGPTAIRADDQPRDPLIGAPMLLNGQAFAPEIPQGALNSDFKDALLQVMTWYQTGFITAEQFEVYANDLPTLAGLQQIIDAGGGRLDIADPADLAMRHFSSASLSEARAALDRGFDVASGPDVEQLAAINALAKGDDLAFFEILLAWTLSEHPDVKVILNPAPGKDGAVRLEAGDSAELSGFLAWMEEKLRPGDMLKGLKDVRVPSGDRSRTRELLRNDDGDWKADAIPMAPSLAAVRAVNSPEEYAAIVEALGLTGAIVSNDHRGKDKMIETFEGESLGYRFNIDESVVGGHFKGFGGNLARTAIEHFAPGTIGETTTFLINAQGETVDNVSNLGDMTVIEQGGVGNRILVDAGDLTYATSGAADGVLRPGGGHVQVIADSSNFLRIEDLVSRNDNATVVTYTGETRGNFFHTDDGVNAVAFEDGNAVGFVLRGDGSIHVELADGAAVSDSVFYFDDTDGTFVTQSGSRLSYSAIFGGDGDDEIRFNGDSVGNVVRLGDGNDYLEIGPDFRGSFDVRDSAASWMWANGDEIHENDVVVLNQPRMTDRLVGEGWKLIDDDTLVAYDEDGSILAQIDLSGDAEHLEQIYVSDGQGGITTLQDIPPEVKSKLAAFGFISQILAVVGTFFPPAAIAGAVTKFIYDAANDNLSFQNAILTAASVASSGSGLGGGKPFAPKWVAPALRGTATALDGDWGNFGKNLFLTTAGLQAEKLLGLQNVELDFAKLSGQVEAAILTVEGLDEGSAFKIAEGVFLLGASVSADGTQQLLLGGADAARVGQAIEDGEVTGILSATGNFLLNQGIFTQQASQIENTPLLKPEDVNIPAAILQGASVAVGFAEAIDNGDSVGQALVDAFPGALESIESFTGRNPVQVFFANLENRVEGRNPFGEHEHLIIVYKDGDAGPERVPLALLDAEGNEAGRIEQAWNGSYNYYLANPDGTERFAFNHDPRSDNTVEDRAPTQAEIDAVDPIVLPDSEGTLVASLVLTPQQLEQGPLTQVEFDALTEQQQELYVHALKVADGEAEHSPKAILPLIDRVRTLSPSAMDAFVSDLLALDDLTGIDDVAGRNAGPNLLGLVWQFSDADEKTRLQDAIERKYENGSLGDFLADFDYRFDPETDRPGDPARGSDQLEPIIRGIDNPRLQADFDYIADDTFRAMYDRLDPSLGHDLYSYHTLPEHRQIGALVADNAFIEEAAQYEDAFTQQNIVLYLMISTAKEAPKNFIQYVDENTKKFLAEFVAEEALEKVVPGYNMYDLLKFGIEIGGNYLKIDQEVERYAAAETPEERAEALRGIVGATKLTTDPAVGFAIAGGTVKALSVGGAGALDGYRALTRTDANGRPDITVETPDADTAAGSDTLPDGTPLGDGETIVEADAVVGGVTGTFYRDAGGKLIFTFVNADGVPDRFDLGDVDAATGRALVEEEFTIDVTAVPDDGGNISAGGSPPTAAPVNPAGIDGTLLTGAPDAPVVFEYEGSDGAIRQLQLPAGTTAAEATQTIREAYIAGGLEGLQPGFDRLTLIDGQQVEVLEVEGAFYARVEGEVTHLRDATDLDAANGLIRQYHLENTLTGAAPAETFRDVRLAQTGDGAQGYAVRLLSPAENGEGHFTIAYTIGGQDRTVHLPPDVITLDEAEAYAGVELEAGNLPGLLPAPDPVSVPDIEPPLVDDGTTDTPAPPASPGAIAVRVGDLSGTVSDPTLSPDGLTRVTYTIGSESHEALIEVSLDGLDLTAPDYSAQFRARAETVLTDLIATPGALEGLSPPLLTPDAGSVPPSADPVAPTSSPEIAPVDGPVPNTANPDGADTLDPTTTVEPGRPDPVVDPGDSAITLPDLFAEPAPDIPTTRLPADGTEPVGVSFRAEDADAAFPDTSWRPPHMTPEAVAQLSDSYAGLGIARDDVPFTPFLPGFAPDPAYSRSSQEISDTLTSNIVAVRNNRGTLRFADVRDSLGTLRRDMIRDANPETVAQQGGAAFLRFGQDRTAETLTWTDADGNVQTASPIESGAPRSALFGPGADNPGFQLYAGRTLRFTEGAPQTASGTGYAQTYTPTIEVGGQTVELSALVNQYDAAGNLTFSFVEHPTAREAAALNGELRSRFAEAQRGGEDAAATLEKIADFAWLYYQALPYFRGSAAIGQWMITGLLQSHGLEYGHLADGVALDLEAFVSTGAEFRDNFGNFFQGGFFEDGVVRPLPGARPRGDTAPLDDAEGGFSIEGDGDDVAGDVELHGQTVDGGDTSGYRAEGTQALAYNPALENAWVNLALVDETTIRQLDLSPLSAAQAEIVRGLVTTEAGADLRALLGQEFASFDDAVAAAGQAQRRLSHQTGGTDASTEIETGIWVFERDGAYVIGESLSIGQPTSSRAPLTQPSMWDTSEAGVIHPHPGIANVVTGPEGPVLDPTQQTAISRADKRAAESILATLQNSGKFPNLERVYSTSINSLSGEMTTYGIGADGTATISFRPGDLEGQPIQDTIRIGGIAFRTWDFLDDATMDLIGATSADTTQDIKYKFYEFFYGLMPEATDALGTPDLVPVELVPAGSLDGTEIGIEIDVTDEFLAAHIQGQTGSVTVDDPAAGLFDDNAPLPDGESFGAVDPTGGGVEGTVFFTNRWLYTPDLAAFNGAVNHAAETVAQGLAVGQTSLTDSLEAIRPEFRDLANDHLRRIFGPAVSTKFAVPRKAQGAESEVRRSTSLSQGAFRPYWEPTFDLILRDWDNVADRDGNPPTFPKEQFLELLESGDAEALSMIYTYGIDLEDGTRIPTATIEFGGRGTYPGNPHSFNTTTVYQEDPALLDAGRAAMEARWIEMQRIEAGDPAAIEAAAGLYFDWSKLYWHGYGDEEIGLSLMAGYLQSRGFVMGDASPDVSLNAAAFQMTRTEFVEAVTSGAAFATPIRPTGDVDPGIEFGVEQDLPPARGAGFGFTLRATVTDSGTVGTSVNEIGVEIGGRAADGTPVTTARPFSGEVFDFDSTHDVIGHAATFMGVDFALADGRGALDGYASEELAAGINFALDALGDDGTLPGGAGLDAMASRFLDRARGVNVSNFGTNPRIDALRDLYIDVFTGSPEGAALAETLDGNRRAAAEWLANVTRQDVGAAPLPPLNFEMTPAQTEFYLRTAHDAYAAIDPEGITQSDIDALAGFVDAGAAGTTTTPEPDDGGQIDLSGESFGIERDDPAADDPLFIREASRFNPQPDVFNAEIAIWGDITSEAIRSGDADLDAILSRIGPRAQALALDQFPGNPELLANYGVERRPGPRSTSVTLPLFAAGVEPTLNHIRSDWSNVTLNGEAPPFGPAELDARIPEITGNGGTIVYNWMAEASRGGPYTIATTTIRALRPGQRSAYPYEMITEYADTPGYIEIVREDLAARWAQIVALEPGSEAAIDGLASFLYDYAKLYWHKHGDGEIMMGLMAGYLDAMGFDVPDLNPGVDLSALSFHTSRDGYVAAFGDGTLFETPITRRDGSLSDPETSPPSDDTSLRSSLEREMLEAGIDPTDVQSISDYYYEMSSYGGRRNVPTFADLNDPRTFETATGVDGDNNPIEWVNDPRAFVAGQSDDPFDPDALPTETFPPGVPPQIDYSGDPNARFVPQYFSVLPGWYLAEEFRSRAIAAGAVDATGELPRWHDSFSHLLMTGDERSFIVDAMNLTDVVDYIIDQTQLANSDSPATRARIRGELVSGQAHAGMVTSEDKRDWEAENGRRWTPDRVDGAIVDFVYDQIEHNYRINRDAGLTSPIGGVGGFIADLAERPESFWYQRPTHLPIIPGNDGSQVDARPR